MMKIQKKSALSTDKNDRRRGRPAGKNRTPLSLEERRARNAQYERERRNETADGMAQLAEAACCDPQIANAELLATVISQLRRRAKKKLPQDVEDLRRTNENLESQIAALQSRLGQDMENIEEELRDCDIEQLSETFESSFQTMETNVRKESKSRTKDLKSNRESDFENRQTEVLRSKKIRKTSKSSSVRAKIPSESNTSDLDSSNSDWSVSVKTEPKQYKLRKRSQKVSEQSECTTSTYLYRTDSESSHCVLAEVRSPKHRSEDSNQSDVLEYPLIDPTLTVTPEQSEQFTERYEDTTLLETLTEGEKRIINEWLDSSETLNAKQGNDDNQVLKFLDFDDFLLDINA